MKDAWESCVLNVLHKVNELLQIGSHHYSNAGCTTLIMMTSRSLWSLASPAKRYISMVYPSYANGPEAAIVNVFLLGHESGSLPLLDAKSCTKTATNTQGGAPEAHAPLVV